MVQYYAAMYNNNSSMRNVHLFSGHVAYVFWIDTVYFQNNLSAQFSKMTIFIIVRGDRDSRANLMPIYDDLYQNKL